MGVSKEALEKVRGAYGKESVMKLSDSPSDVEFLSTGSLELDYMLGGGFPKGRIIEIYGAESVGKTTVTIEAIAAAQKAGLNAFFCDAEHAFDSSYAEDLGVDIDELIITQPDNGEQALDVTRAMIDTGEVQLAIVDSTSTLTPQAELEGEVGDAQMGLQARMLSKALRMLTASVKKHNCVLIFISQTRDKIGPFGGSSVGVGNAMKFYASQRISIWKSAPEKVKEEAVGHMMNFESKKNKVFPPFKKCGVFLRYGEGYDTNAEVLTLCVDMGIAERKGAWYSYEGTKLGNGKENALKTLKENPDLFDEMREKAIEGLKQQ